MLTKLRQAMTVIASNHGVHEKSIRSIVTTQEDEGVQVQIRDESGQWLFGKRIETEGELEDLASIAAVDPDEESLAEMEAEASIS